jgi:ankyrin repeat protein
LFHGFNDVVSLLLSFGADMDKRDEDGIQAPFVAIQSGNIDGIRILVDHGLSLHDLKSEV